MIPIYSCDYLVGELLLSKYFGIDTAALNPSWMTWLNEKLHFYTGICGISWWSFLIGGNLIGLAVAGMLYPISKHIFARLIEHKKQ